MSEFDLPFAKPEVVRDLSTSKGEPQWMLDQRLRALQTFLTSPIEPSQIFFRYADLSGVKFEDLGLAVPGTSRSPGKLSPGLYAELNLSDKSSSVDVCSELAAKGVVVETLEDAVLRHPDIVKPHIEKLEGFPRGDKFANLSASLASAGMLLWVPDGMRLEEPVSVRLQVDSGRAFFARTLLVLGRGAEATVAEEYIGGKSNGRQSLLGSTTEVHLGEGSRLNFASVQDLPDDSVALLNRAALADRNSSLQWAFGGVGSMVTKSRVETVLAGQGSSVKQSEVIYGSGTERYDLTSIVRHSGPDTTSDLISKGVMRDKSKSYFKGLIVIEKGGKGSDSFLGQYAMLITRDARSIAIPSLEIENHEVRRAKHSASVAQIDEAQVFYLMSRGLPEEEARKMIVQGFLEPLVERIALESSREHLRHLIGEKVAG